MKDDPQTMDGLLNELQAARKRIAELEETASTRTRAEQTLRDANMRLQSLIDANIIGVTIATFSGGIVETNDHYLNMIGYTREEFEHGLVDWRNITPPEWLPVDEHCLEELRTRGVCAPYEKEYMRRDGSRVTIFLTCALLPGPEREIASFVLDITDRKHAEEALRASEEKFSLAFRSSPSTMGITSVRDGRFIDVNDRFLNDFGYQRDEVIGRTSADLNIWVDLVNREATWQKLIVYGVANDIECQFRDKHGEIHWGLTSSAMITFAGEPCILTQTIDITERKRTEENLRDERQRLEGILKGTNAGTWEWNVKTGETIFNERWAEILGYTMEEIAPVSIETWMKFCHPDDLKASEELLEKHFRGELDYYECEARMRHKDGAWVWILDRGRVVTWTEGGKPLMMMGTHQDITERKRAEEALRASEAFRGRVFDSSPIPIVVMDAATWTYIDCNQAAVEIYRFASREETLGKSPLDVSTPVQYDGLPSLEKTRCYIERAQAEGQVVFEWRHQRPSGEIWDAEVHLMSFQDGQRELLQFTLQDTTERKQAEETLHLFKDLVEHSFDAIGMSTPEGRHYYQNKAFDDLFGDVGNNPSDTLFVDKEFGRQVFNTIMRGDSWQGEVKMFKKDGSILDIYERAYAIRNQAGRIIAIVGLHTDITERKQAEEALRASEEKFRLLTEGMKDVVWTADPLTMDFLYMSPSVLALSGFAPQEIMADSTKMGLPPEDRARVNELARRRAADFLSGKEEPGRFYIDEIEQTRNDGSTVWTEVISRYYHNEKTGKVEMRGVTRDISERKRSEEEREKLQAQLLQSQKMESVGRLAGGMAHDFNNMLMAILGHTELALMQCGEADPIHADLKVIEKSAQRSAELIRQLLGFARKQTVAPKVLDLNETVAGILKMLQRIIGEDIDFAWMPGGGLWPVKIDPTQIDQLLVNLCVNARDAISGVGKISIETENKVFDEAYCALHPEYNPGKYVMLAVSDTGCGMDKETLANIFEPFFTTKGIGKGTGLGLATVYGIVKQNEGFINVYSEPGKGTIFKLYLRRFAGEIQIKTLENPVEIPRGHGETLLMVEDDPATLNIGKLLLETLGYTVLSASTPDEALRLAQAHAAEIALLMSDVIMPEMNGRELAKSIAAIKPGLKCLFSSGYTANVIAHRGILDEGVYFLQKPYSMKDLAIKVRQALG